MAKLDNDTKLNLRIAEILGRFNNTVHSLKEELEDLAAELEDEEEDEDDHVMSTDYGGRLFEEPTGSHVESTERTTAVVIPVKKAKGKGKGKKYPWNKFLEGKTGKCLGYIYLRNNGVKDSDMAIEHGEVKGSVDKRALLDWVLERCPELAVSYKEYIGKDLAPKLFFDRLNNMWFQNSGIKGVKGEFVPEGGSEHPRHHKELRIVLKKLLKDNPEYRWDDEEFL